MNPLIQIERTNGYAGNAMVMGLGRSGLACASYLIDEGWDVEMAEIKSQPGLEAKIRSTLPGVSINAPVEFDAFGGKDLVVLSCTSAPSNLGIVEMAAANGVPVMNSLELLFDRAKQPIVSVSGTNGKSSVTTLVRNIIERHRATVQLGGCRGNPFVELLSKRRCDVNLLELSAQHLEQVNRVSSDVAAILNVSPDHMERYGSVDSLVKAMGKVVRDAKIAVINRDDSIASLLPTSGERITFGLNPPENDKDYGIADFSGMKWIVRGQSKLINLSRCKLSGHHNWMNMLASCAIADATGYPVKAVRTALTNFEGLPYRCSTEGEWNGVQWVNDARSANVGAALAAIQSNTRPVILIAGGLSKGADFSLIPRKVNGRLRGCIFFGRDRRKISEPFNGNIAKHYVEDVYDAISLANSMTKEGDCVVFSPGCASNDQFSDYEHRGKTFSQALQMQVL